MDNFKASVLMVIAMALFVIEDALIKVMAQVMPVAQVMMIIGLGGGVIFWVVGAQRGLRFLSRDAVRGVCLWRNLLEACGAFCMVQALALIPVSTVAAILQASPLVVTMGAALFLGETVGWRRWSAILIGGIGVMIILRPGTEGFEPAALWAVATVGFLGARDLITRRLPVHVHSLQVAGWGFLSLAPAGLLHLPFGGAPIWPTPDLWWVIGTALIFGPLGYVAVVVATRIGEASAVAPFRYSRLVFAIIVGGIAFGERPDAYMIVGALIVAGSGLYTFTREARLRRAARMSEVKGT